MGVREITAEEAAKRRAKAVKKEAPSSGFLRDFAEGVATTIGHTADSLASFPLKFAYTGGREYAPFDKTEKAADTISEATSENPTRSRVAGSGVGGLVQSVPVMAATGGLTLPTVAAGAVGGAVGALSSDEARRRGYGPVGQFVAGMGGDILGTGLARGAMALPSLAEDVFSPSRRAGRMIAPIGLGQETADDAAMALQDASAAGKWNENMSWADQRATSTPATAPSAPFHNLSAQHVAATDLNPVDLPAISRRIPDVLGPEVDVDRIQDVLHNVSSIQRATEPTYVAKRLAGEYRGVADDALDVIEQLSSADKAAVDALRQARQASAEFHAAFPDDSALYRYILSEKALDEPQAAFVKILQSPQAETEMSNVVGAISGNAKAKRGVANAVVRAVIGDTPEVAGARQTSALIRLDKWNGPARVALGDKAYDSLRSMLSDGTTENRNRAWSLVGAAGRSNAPGGVVGAALGGFVGGPVASAAGAALGTAGNALVHYFSPRNVREIAITALYDPVLRRQITRQIPKGVTQAEWVASMAGSLVRRGLLTREEAKQAKDAASKDRKKTNE